MHPQARFDELLRFGFILKHTATAISYGSWESYVTDVNGIHHKLLPNCTISFYLIVEEGLCT